MNWGKQGKTWNFVVTSLKNFTCNFLYVFSKTLNLLYPLICMKSKEVNKFVYPLKQKRSWQILVPRMSCGRSLPASPERPLMVLFDDSRNVQTNLIGTSQDCCQNVPHGIFRGLSRCCQDVYLMSKNFILFFCSKH